jgi:PTH1 family peptidyl-tRNA hydrolase
MKLIVGLGNPGKEYAGTRHNAGFYWIDRLAEALGITLKSEARFHGIAVRIQQNNQECWLLQPQTYMNASGRAVIALSQFYKIHPDEIMIVHELDLLPGEAVKKGWPGRS